MSATTDSYQELSRDEAVRIKDRTIKHASHVMLYAKVDEKLFDHYKIKYAILVSYNREVCTYHQYLTDQQLFQIIPIALDLGISQNLVKIPAWN